MFKTTKQYVDMRLYRYAEDGLYGEVLNPIEYEVCKELTIKVPKGFKTDFASIPRVFYNIITPIGKHTQPAILHDYLYSEGAKLGYTRKNADVIFREAMLECGVNPFTAGLMYYAVRLFGKSHYNKG